MKIALIGNQNSGKSTLFNQLTGMNQKIGNWAGVTVERKSGTIKTTDFELVDLPGVYSLSPYTQEEKIARGYLLNDKPDLIINIIDLTSIERSLYLTTQVLELGIPVFVVLNMKDLAKRKGITIKPSEIEKALGAKVFEISALKKQGVEALIEAVKSFSNEPKAVTSSPKPFDDEIENFIENVNIGFADRFFAIKMLEQDEISEEYISRVVLKNREDFFAKSEGDIVEKIASQRYCFIEDLKKLCVEIIPVKESFSDKIDKVVLNKYVALPIFAGIMFLVYFLSVGLVGGALAELGWVESLGELCRTGLTNAGASEWAISLLVDGVIAGVGAVVSFVPQILILFLLISLLEATGYMARIAFMMDVVFKKLGLSGKSIIPFIVGSGCSVPAIMATRTIENQKEREATIYLTPFVPCSAKLPIIAMFSGYFFGDASGLVSVSFYFLAIVVIIASALILKKIFKKKEASVFISELPEYKAPDLSYVAKDVAVKVWAFIKKAGTIIFTCSVVVWFLSSFSWGFKYGVDIDKSILAGLGNAFAWFFYPIVGEWNWGVSVSAIQGLVAKEQVVSSLEIISSLSGGGVFEAGTFGFFTKASAYAFTAFNLFSVPCLGAVGAMKKELGNNKKFAFAIFFQLGLAWALSSIIFGIGKLFEVIV